jgi:spermidine/putrescine transport system ATP-binding protein
MAGTAPAEIRKRTAEALALVSLLDRGERRPDQLSGGQQQRVACITFIYVTHDQEEAMTMSDRIAVMNHGRVMQVGTPQEIYDHPSNLFVADFIGTSNVLEGTVLEVGGGWVTVQLDFGVRVRVPAGARKGWMGRVSVVVRPDRMSLSNVPASTPETNTISGTVAKVSYLGMYLQVTVATPQGRDLTVIEPLSSDRPERASPDLGGAIHVTWPAALSLCFDDEGS